MRNLGLIISGLFLFTSLILAGCSSSKTSGELCASGGCQDTQIPPDDPPSQLLVFEEQAGRHSSLAISSEGQWALTAFEPTSGALRLGFGPAPDELEWTTIEEDAPLGIGKFNQCLFDQNGTLHILYYDGKNTDLKYARVDDGNAPTLETIDANGDVGLSISATIDDNDQLHVSYYDQTRQRLKYATRTADGEWSLEVIPAPAGVGCDAPPCPTSTTAYGKFSSIGLKGGWPLVAYYDQSQGNLILATRDESQWNALVVDGLDATTGEDTGDVGTWPSIRVDEKGNTSIAYFEQHHGSLKYASSSQGQIKVEAIDTGASVDVDTGTVFNHIVGAHVQLIDSSSGEPMLFYLNATTFQIRRAKRAGGTWSFSSPPIDAPSGVGLTATKTANGNIALLFEQWEWTASEDGTLERRLALWLE
jgi:hypothetical protein